MDFKSLLVVVFGLFANLAQASDRPTFILVHGALFTSSGWAKTQNLLQEVGYNVVTLDVPGRLGSLIHSPKTGPVGEEDPKQIDIHRAARKVCRVVKLQKGKVILVGHSQGGALITQAFSDCGENVSGLVYVAAVVPFDKEIAFQALDPEKDTGFGKCATPDPASGLFKLNETGPLAELFFADAPESEKKAIVASMVSEPMAIGTTPLKVDMKAWEAIPKFYVEATEDKIISIETQRKIQSRVKWAGAYSIESSHCPFLSRPLAFTLILRDVAGELR